MFKLPYKCWKIHYFWPAQTERVSPDFFICCLNVRPPSPADPPSPQLPSYRGCLCNLRLPSSLLGPGLHLDVQQELQAPLCRLPPPCASLQTGPAAEGGGRPTALMLCWGALMRPGLSPLTWAPRDLCGPGHLSPPTPGTWDMTGNMAGPSNGTATAAETRPWTSLGTRLTPPHLREPGACACVSAHVKGGAHPWGT